MITGNTESKASIKKTSYANADINLIVVNPIQSKHGTTIDVNTSVKNQ